AWKTGARRSHLYSGLSLVLATNFRSFIR
ncbi:hypothetical protein CCACVL1_22437, partial [Corchorus capsularis]